MFVIKHYWVDPIHKVAHVETAGRDFTSRALAEHVAMKAQKAEHDEQDFWWVEEES